MASKSQPSSNSQPSYLSALPGARVLGAGQHYIKEAPAGGLTIGTVNHHCVQLTSSSHLDGLAQAIPIAAEANGTPCAIRVDNMISGQVIGQVSNVIVEEGAFDSNTLLILQALHIPFPGQLAEVPNQAEDAPPQAALSLAQSQNQAPSNEAQVENQNSQNLNNGAGQNVRAEASENNIAIAIGDRGEGAQVIRKDPNTVYAEGREGVPVHSVTAVAKGNGTAIAVGRMWGGGQVIDKLSTVIVRRNGSIDPQALAQAQEQPVDAQRQAEEARKRAEEQQRKAQAQAAQKAGEGYSNLGDLQSQREGQGRAEGEGEYANLPDLQSQREQGSAQVQRQALEAAEAQRKVKEEAEALMKAQKAQELANMKVDEVLGQVQEEVIAEKQAQLLALETQRKAQAAEAERQAQLLALEAQRKAKAAEAERLAQEAAEALKAQEALRLVTPQVYTPNAAVTVKNPPIPPQELSSESQPLLAPAPSPQPEVVQQPARAGVATRCWRQIPSSMKWSYIALLILTVAAMAYFKFDMKAIAELASSHKIVPIIVGGAYGLPITAWLLIRLYKKCQRQRA